MSDASYVPRPIAVRLPDAGYVGAATLTGVAREQRRSVEALGETERPRDERPYPGSIGMERVQHDVRVARIIGLVVWPSRVER